MHKTVYFLLLIFPLHTYCQRINNNISYRNIGSNSYFRLSYDNDYFTATDRYYTQGINAEWVSPVFSKNPLNLVLFKIRNQPIKFGIGVDHFGFTPTSIRRNEIIQGDRPFAACLSLKSFNVIYDTNHRRIYTSSISFGVIGPWAGGEGMQKGIHRAIGDIEPLGWQNQIRNDINISYEASVEKLLYRYRQSFALNRSSGIKVGTLNDKINLGINFRLGKLDPIFKSGTVPKFQIYFFSESVVNCIGYDATLQGGMFNKSSPYTIKAKDIRRFTFQENFGGVLKWKKIYLEYFQSALTQEFRKGKKHRWGGIKIGIAI
jgi:lipid A 3-O-deacylase